MCRNGQNSDEPIEYYVSDQKSKFSQDLAKWISVYIQVSTNDKTNIWIYSDKGKTTNMNTNDICGKFDSNILINVVLPMQLGIKRNWIMEKL